MRLVSVDGPGGAGKSTFAARLAHAAGGAPIVHTDDFATAEEPIDWWPRLLQQVIVPIVDGRSATFQRYDWELRRMADWVTVERSPVVIIEGVSAGRDEWREHLAYSVWIHTSAETRLRRGLDRDGDDMLDQWATWMAAEDRHFKRDGAPGRADTVVDGEPALQHDPQHEFIALRGARPRSLL